MDKCIYCNKKIDPDNLIITGDKSELLCCSEDCERKVTEFESYYEKSKPCFLLGIFLATGLILSGAIANVIVQSEILLSGFITGGFVLMGIVLLIFPFATPESFENWGIKKTKKIVRTIGACLILLGPFMSYYIWFG